MKTFLWRSLLTLALWHAGVAGALAQEGVKNPLLDLPTTSAAQKSALSQLNDHVQHGDYQQALAQYRSGFGGSRFFQSVSGQATEAYLMFRIGLENLALERLFSIKNIDSMSPALKKLWVKTVPADHPVWKTASLRWHNAQLKVFKGIFRSQSLPFPVYSVNGEADLLKLAKQIQKQGWDKEQGAWHKMQVSLWSGVLNANASSLKGFDNLSEDESLSSVDKDRVWLNRGRVLFQDGRHAEAIESYNQVSKGSDYWLEAVEEKGWAYLRLDQPDKTLAQVKTLTAPMFVGQVGPEAHFMGTLTHLKICDYKSIFEDIKTFKKSFGDRLKSIEQMAKTGQSPEAEAAIEKLSKGPYRLKTIARELGLLPRLFHRDQFIRWNVEKYGSYRKEAALAAQLESQGTLGGNSSKVAQGRAEGARADVYKRLKYLAEWEVEEFKKIIQKLHIVEAEVIQRIHKNQEISNKRSDRSEKVAQNDNTLVFPVTKEVWFDEVDNYHVGIKDCPSLQEKKL